MALWRRPGLGLVLAAAVLLVHGLLLGVFATQALPQFSQAVSSSGQAVAMQLVPRNPAVDAPRVSATDGRPDTAVNRVVSPVAASVAAPAAPKASARRKESAEAMAVSPVLRPTTPAQSGADAPAAALDGADTPVYATALPASVSLHFVLRRGPLTGAAELHWQRRGDDYDMLLEGALQGLPVLASTSTGSIDADGVAPQRHAERKRAREVRAVNFQRDAGFISFSGPDLQLPLRPGAQDRLSWLVQLPAIFEADPALSAAGAQVTLFVVGSRGDAQAWRFQVLGREALDLPAGPAANTVRLLREPSRPFDTRAEVWLDPAREHLPVRAVFTTVPGGQPLELQLSHAIGAAP